MKRSNKKGFTIVELVIVIAIIAILAAVLIPTFASLIQKANESKDTQLVKNLNTALAADNKEHKTMTDALDAAVEFGYDVGKINASATGNEILWDSKNDVFCYLKDGKVEYIPETSLKNGAVAENETYKLWKIYTSEAKIKEDTDANKYFSIYWNSADNFTAPLTVGFDAGNNTAITALTYNGVGTKQEVVIRTNGGTLTVNAPADTVNHYGYATVVTVTEVAKESYHENGKVDEIKLAWGRVVVESDGEVGSVMVTASAAADVKVENKSGKLGGVAASNSDVASKLKNQVTGVDESKVLNKAVDNSKFAGGLGTEDAPYLIATAEQWKNIKPISNEGKSFKVISDLDFSGTDDIAIGYFSGILDFDNHTVSGVSESNTQGPQGWTGWLIWEAGSSETTVKISNLNFNIDAFAALIFESNYSKELLLENITVNGSAEIAGDNNYSPFISRIVSKKDAKATVIMRNCVNNANITNNGCTGVFVGKVQEDSGLFSANITFENCVNNGTIIRTTNGYASMLFANPCTFTHQNEEDIKIINCENNGYIAGTAGARIVSADNGNKWNKEKENSFISSVGSNFKQTEANVGTLTVGTLTVSDGYFVLPKVTNAARYTFSFGFWNTVYKDSTKAEKLNWGATSLTFAFANDQLKNAKLEAKKFEQYDYANASKNTEKELFGVKYYINSNGNYVYSVDLSKWGDGAYAEINLQPTVSFVAYNESGVPIAVYSFDLSKLN